jgi:hypothetical protein
VQGGFCRRGTAPNPVTRLVRQHHKYFTLLRFHHGPKTTLLVCWTIRATQGQGLVGSGRSVEAFQIGKVHFQDLELGGVSRVTQGMSSLRVGAHEGIMERVLDICGTGGSRIGSRGAG